MVPKFCGFPLWKNLRQRIAKKHLPRWNQFNNGDGQKLEIGGLFQACDAFNHRLASAKPEYYRVGHGWVLGNVDLVSTDGTYHNWNGCCTFAWSVERIHKYNLEFLLDWTANSNWYGSADASEMIRDKNLLAYLQAGNLITDEFGCKLPDLKERVANFIASRLSV